MKDFVGALLFAVLLLGVPFFVVVYSTALSVDLGAASGSVPEIAAGSSSTCSQNSLSGRPQSCARLGNMSDGELLDVPPFYIPPHCALQSLTFNDSVECLTGRKVYVLGNSVARGIAFELALAVGSKGLPGNRTDQKRMCGVGRPVDCKLPTVTGIDVEYLPMFAADAPRSVEHIPDCAASLLGTGPGGRTRQCLCKRLSSSRKGDVLIFGHGLGEASLIYMWGSNDIHDQYKPYSLREEWGTQYPTATWATDFKAWLNRSANTWIDVVTTCWHGAPHDVYRLRTPPLLLSVPHGAFHDGTQNFTPVVNSAFDSAWASQPWGVIDTWGVNSVAVASQKYWHLYQDIVHHAGRLSQIAVEAVLSDLCPRQRP